MDFIEKKNAMGNRMEGVYKLITGGSKSYGAYTSKDLLVDMVNAYVANGDTSLKGKLHNIGRNLVKFAEEEGLTLTYIGDTEGGLTILELLDEIAALFAVDVINFTTSSSGTWNTNGPITFGNRGGYLMWDSTKVTYGAGATVTPSRSVSAGNHTLKIQGAKRDGGYSETFKQKGTVTSVKFYQKYISPGCFNETGWCYNVDAPLAEYVGEWGLHALHNYDDSNTVTINLPVCTEIKKGGCCDNNIGNINAPKLKIIGASGLKNNRLNNGKCNFFNTVESIGYYALAVNNFTSLNFPVCTFVDNFAFEDCTSALSANFPKLPAIGEYAFRRCRKLWSINIPLVTVISVRAFTQCNKLKEIDLSNITRVEHHAFAECYELQPNLPKCEFLGEGCFDYNTSMNYMNLPKLKKMEGWVFNGCSALTTLLTPVLEEITGDNLFNSCSQNIDWYVPDTPPVAIDGLFTDYTGTIKLHVRSTAIRDAYKASTGFTGLTNDNFVIEDWVVIE